MDVHFLAFNLAARAGAFPHARPTRYACATQTRCNATAHRAGVGPADGADRRRTFAAPRRGRFWSGGWAPAAGWWQRVRVRLARTSESPGRPRNRGCRCRTGPRWVFHWMLCGRFTLLTAPRAAVTDRLVGTLRLAADTAFL